MYTKKDLLCDIEKMGLRPDDTLLIHSSMKAIGQVEGGADTVLNAFSEYLADGLLVLPTHTWATVTPQHPDYDPETEPSCVGLLTNLFRQRPGVVRSLHPTHSVAALGRDAAGYVAGEEHCASPCPREGCWGRLYNRRAKILFLGCAMRYNTFLHSVEEWSDVPLRLTAEAFPFRVKTPAGWIETPVRRHESPFGDVSRFYGKMQPLFVAKGAAKETRFGDAVCMLGDAVAMADITTACLRMKRPRRFK